MLGAILSLAVGLTPPEREYTGVEAEPGSTPAPEQLPVPAPATAPPPAPAPEPPAPVPAPARQVPAADPRPKPTPKWWGPFPRPKLTGFGGPVAHATGLTGKFAMFVGLAGGLSIRQRVSIGANLMWLLNPVDAGLTELGAKQRLNMNYGGVLLDVVLVHRGRVDLSLTGLLGGGGACLQNPEKGTCHDRTSFFLGQPNLAVHVRLLPVLRLVFGAGYRFVVAKQWSGPSGAPLGGPVATVMLELGWF